MVIQPVFPQAPDVQSGYPHRALHRDISQQLDADGIAFVDLLDAFEASDQPLGYFGLDIWHPNEQGHGIIADALLDKVVPVALGHGRPGGSLVNLKFKGNSEASTQRETINLVGNS